MGKGLIYCGGDWNNSFCITKLTEAFISGLLLVFTLIQIMLNIHSRGGIYCGFTETIQILMILTLICNLAFCINHELSWFYYLQSFLYDCYFSTLVFYVTFRILEQRPSQNKNKLTALKIAYGIFILIFFSIFIFSGIVDFKSCKQAWFLAIDFITFLICAFMIKFGYTHHKNQTQKIEDFKNQKQIYNPLSKMWTIILINLFCQIVQLTESLVFYFQTKPQKCSFTNEQIADDIIKLIFSIFSLHLSFLCTIIIFHLRRIKQQNAIQPPIRKQTIVTNFIQMSTIQKSQNNQNPLFI